MRHRILAGLLVLAACGGGGKNDDTLVAYGRENNSGTYMYFKEHVLKDEDFAANIQTLPGTAAVINAVSKDRHSIGYGGIGYLKGVRALRLKKDATSPAVEPTMGNVLNGSYPISRSLYFYTVGEPEGGVREFIAWVLSPEGQTLCEKVGYYPLPADRRAVPGAASGPAKKTISMKGSDTMVILGQRWAEQYMSRNPGVLIQVTGGGSGTGIAALINGSTDICQASRSMKAKERDQVREKFGKIACEIPVALDGLAVFVHDSNPIHEMSLDQVKAIYTGKAKRWKDVSEAAR